MEQNTLYTAIGRLDRETNGCGRSCPVIRLSGQTYMAVSYTHLALFMPFAALAPLLKVCFTGDCGQLWPTVAEALAGALLGFCIPLAAAIATGGTGLGGGDIKSVSYTHLDVYKRQLQDPQRCRKPP